MPHLKLLRLALSFYTRVPSPSVQDYQDLPKATVFLPLIGWLVGGVAALIFILADLLWSQATAVILAFIAGIFLTGAFHEDGFADVCDGFGGGYTQQRILEIMKDSAIGVYGCLGLVLIFLLKFNLLNDAQASAVPLMLLVGHSLSRLSPLLLMHHYEYARADHSKAAAAVYKPTPSELTLATTIAVLPLVLLPKLCWLAVLPVLVVNAFLGRYFYRHIGGYTGDCLGASQQVAEVVFYFSVQGLWIYI
ncbi:MAG: adenosylcobinamide-GDP ribazoletransferase [Methylococcaceae bacterium]|nr:adenosylcobinamide-GDP ribazoletransferase [Methylococcaceae bacterium]